MPQEGNALADDARPPGLLRITFAVLIWFVFNISMASLTKWTFLHGSVCSGHTSQPHCTTYQFPFMVTAQHMIFSWLACSMVINQRQKRGPMLDFDEQVKKIMPLAVAYAVSLALGNLSLKYIFPSFNQMLSSMSPLVTVLMSLMLHGKRYNLWTWISMPVICGGLLVCSNQEVNYNLLGVLSVAGATILRAVKSVIQEQLLDPKAKALDSVSLLYFLAPWTAGFLIVLSLLCEGLDPWRLLIPQENQAGLGRLYLLLVLSAINACFLNVAGNQVTAYTGAVMLQVLGNVKACFSILVSITIFGNPVTILQGLGVVVCLAGVALYNWKGGVVKNVVQSTPPSTELADISAIGNKEQSAAT